MAARHFSPAAVKPRTASDSWATTVSTARASAATATSSATVAWEFRTGEANAVVVNPTTPVGEELQPHEKQGERLTGVVVELSGEGHNDGLMLFFGLAGLLAFRLFKKGAPPTPDLAIQEAKATRAELEAQKIERDQVSRSLENGDELKA